MHSLLQVGGHILEQCGRCRVQLPAFAKMSGDPVDEAVRLVVEACFLGIAGGEFVLPCGEAKAP